MPPRPPYGDRRPGSRRGRGAVLAAGAVRALRGLGHARAAVAGLRDDRNQLLLPPGVDSESLRSAWVISRADLNDSESRPLTLTLTTWNLHHGNGPDRSGAPDTLEAQLDWLRRDGAAVSLLQEVTPWQARRLVDGTGRVGWFAPTTPSQGNLVLVAPDLGVERESRHTVSWPQNRSGGGPRGPWATAFALGGVEARVVQVLHLRLPGGATVLVVGTHLSTGASPPEVRAAEARELLRLLEAEPSYPLVGGGDLNSGADGPTPTLLREKGFRVEGSGIDHVFTRGLADLEVAVVDPHVAGVRLSDHPVVRARVTLPVTGSGRGGPRP